MAWFSRRNRNSLVADAEIVSGPGATDPAKQDSRGPRYRVDRSPDEWQREVWDFYDSLGEFRQGITWKANMLSRVRLIAAKRVAVDDDPVPITTGPAAEIMKGLAGGIGGQAGLMAGFAVYLDVPGECYMIGETQIDGKNKWYLRSIEEVQAARADGPGRFQVAEGNGRWRILSNESLVVRVHRPHKRWNYVADSPARACRTLMRELELINRHIQAQYLSRLASAGIIAFPEEVSMPIRPEFADAADPFVAEWIEVAAEAIRTPGTAASVVPIPMRMPGEYIDKIKHIDFTLKLDDKIIEKRDSALTRLAIGLDMPPEALTGTGNVNHWTAWLIDEQAVKIHIAPDAEVICDSVTKGYLIPMLEAANEDIENVIAWYDASDLVLRPDRSKSAADLYDRAELSGESLRAESGFDENDKPSDDERQQILLQKIVASQAVNAMGALKILFPDIKLPETPAPPADAPRPPTENVPGSPDKATDIPKGTPQGTEPTAPTKQEPGGKVKKAAEATRVSLIKQSGLRHAVRINFDGRWTLLHPVDCLDHLISCPVTHATWKPKIDVMPGAPGVYECWLNHDGEPRIGPKITDGAAIDMLSSTFVDPVNHSYSLIP